MLSDDLAALRAQVSVRILGGLMALGYQIGTIMKRTSAVFSDDRLTVKVHCNCCLPFLQQDGSS